jgi:hypothetical protein
MNDSAPGAVSVTGTTWLSYVAGSVSVATGGRSTTNAIGTRTDSSWPAGWDVAASWCVPSASATAATSDPAPPAVPVQITASPS